MLSWEKYLLIKLSEEANEVAKEALKNTQFGGDSHFKDVKGDQLLSNEIIDQMAVMEMVAELPAYSNALGYLKASERSNKDPDVCRKIEKKKYKVCYYAMISIQLGHLIVSEDEARYIYDNAKRWEGGIGLGNNSNVPAGV